MRVQKRRRRQAYLDRNKAKAKAAADQAAGHEGVEDPGLLVPVPVQVHAADVRGGVEQPGEGGVVEPAVHRGEQSADRGVAVGRLVPESSHEVVGERLDGHPNPRADATWSSP